MSVQSPMWMGSRGLDLNRPEAICVTTVGTPMAQCVLADSQPVWDVVRPFSIHFCA